LVLAAAVVVAGVGVVALAAARLAVEWVAAIRAADILVGRQVAATRALRPLI